MFQQHRHHAIMTLRRSTIPKRATKYRKLNAIETIHAAIMEVCELNFRQKRLCLSSVLLFYITLSMALIIFLVFNFFLFKSYKIILTVNPFRIVLINLFRPKNDFGVSQHANVLINSIYFLYFIFSVVVALQKQKNVKKKNKQKKNFRKREYRWWVHCVMNSNFQLTNWFPFDKHDFVLFSLSNLQMLYDCISISNDDHQLKVMI